jgi:hypothetical protein
MGLLDDRVIMIMIMFDKLGRMRKKASDRGIFRNIQLIMGKTSQNLGRGPEGTLSKCGYVPLSGCTEQVTVRESSLVQVTGCTQLKKKNCVVLFVQRMY